MRIVIDLDGTICYHKEEWQTYSDVLPKEGVQELIRGLREKGHYIIISTARNMLTCDSNVGKVIKNIGKITLEWLERHQIEYDEIYFGKPNGEIYIDDRALRFEGSWVNINEDFLKTIALPR
jgi:capsule biosynthesis phosphatase